MKQNKPLILILGILLALAVAVGLYFGVKALTGSSETPDTAPDTASASAPAATGSTPAATGTPADTGTAADPQDEDPAITAVRAKAVYTDESLTLGDARLTQLAAECGDWKLTNSQLQIYYGLQYFTLLNQYGIYISFLGIDTTLPLYEQTSTVSDLTWEQYFMMEAMDYFQQLAALATRAAAEGHTIPADYQQELDSLEQNLTAEALAYGYASADDYIRQSFGPNVGLAEYQEYLRTYFLAMSYEEELYYGVVPTEEELTAYYEAHPEDFEGMSLDTANINVRHILITPDADSDATDEEMAAANAAAKAKAEEILAEYLANPTEENFAALAETYSEDPGSSTNGGLYEDVAPGDMVEPFDNWCFDESRQTGDTGIVETSYGYHVMFFAGRTDNYQWKQEATEAIRQERLTPVMEEIMEASPLTTHYENAVLAPLPLDEAE